ncbi:unnamed protein product [Parajaminaea phylloscopi]
MYEPDLIFLAFATYQLVRGIQPPHIATRDDRARAGGKDWASQWGLTRLHLPVQAIAIGLALWTGRTIVRNDGYEVRGSALTSKSWRTVFWVGATLTALGGWGRSRCHRELGRFFTFDLAVQKGQKVIQSGPYSLVRHPAYTCTVVLITGALTTLCLANPGVNAKWKRRVLVGMILRPFIDLWLFYKRISEEEAMLHQELGAEYAAYVRKVPYRLVPGIF